MNMTATVALGPGHLVLDSSLAAEMRKGPHDG